MSNKPIAISIIIAIVLVQTLSIALQAIALGYIYINEVKLIVPAVSSTGHGVTSELIVKVAYPGNGNVYFLTEPLTQLDTQASAKIAALVATNILNIDFFKYDYFFELRSKSMIIGGPSAGAAMTIAVMAALLNATLRKDISITGMIEPNGVIGPVGGIPEKLEAVAKKGCKIFLIPLGQRYSTVPVQKQLPGGIIITTYKTVDVVKEGEKLGVKVIEVGDIRQALYYFTGINLTLKTIEKWQSFRPSLPQKAVSIIKKWAIEISKEANKTLSEVYEMLNNLSSGVKALVNKYIKICKREASAVNNLLNKGYVYEAASSAYRTLIYSTTAKYICLLSLGKEDVNSLVSKVNETLKKAKEEIFKYKPKTIGEVEVAIASRLRYYIAEEMALSAFKSVKEETITVDAVYMLASAKCRAETAKKWIELAQATTTQMNVNEDLVLKVASTMMYEARSVVSYTQSLISSSSTVEDALKYVEKSINAYDEGDMYGSIGLSLMALTLSIKALNEAFQLKGTINKTLDIIASSTINQINGLLRNNITPVLSLNYLESAQISYIMGEVDDCYTYLTLSSLHAHVLNLILLGTSSKVKHETITQKTQSIQEVTKTTTQTTTVTKTITSEKDLITGFIIGLMIGLIIAIAIMIAYKPRTKIEQTIPSPSSEEQPKA